MALGGLLVLAVARMVIAAAGRFEMIMVGDVLVAVANAGTAALLHPPPALAGVPIAQERRCQRFFKTVPEHIRRWRSAGRCRAQRSRP